MRSFLRAIWFVLSTDCQRSARLTSDSCDRQLTRLERLAVQVHNATCRKSRKLARQIKTMGIAMKRLADQAPPRPQLSEDAKRRIARKMNEV